MDFLLPDSWLNASLTAVSDALWTYVLIAALIVCGLYFTIRTRAVQFTMVGEMFRQLLEPVGGEQKPRGRISSFHAFAVSVATRVGTGNLAGVAIAIAVGGPGAVFWMWVIALIGSATAFIESTLAQLYKRRTPDGEFIGGPAYYILHGLHSRWMAAVFAVLITLTFGLSYNSIQSNTIVNAMHEAFGLDKIISGVVVAATSLIIVFGGIQRIARVSSVLVPLMAIGYFVVTSVV
ncbi:MAG: sodium:alanine symporter family protein, partial [Muribaculaceae bacterium]|nr:sodium:alanine symporter family protein [Muribaculaceae bacterium]